MPHIFPIRIQRSVCDDKFVITSSFASILFSWVIANRKFAPLAQCNKCIIKKTQTLAPKLTLTLAISTNRNHCFDNIPRDSPGQGDVLNKYSFISYKVTAFHPFCSQR